MQLKDKVLKGDKYGRLTLTGEFTIGNKSHVYVRCVCDCGEEITKRFTEVYVGTTKTCGNKKCTSEIQKKIISTGHRYGRLVLTGNDKMAGRIRYLEAVCNCGTIGFYPMSSIFSGDTSSCGCYQKEKASLANITHGLTKRNITRHPIYNTWAGVKQRCSNPKSLAYVNYGARVIKICNEWVDDFMAFYVWSMGNGWAAGLSLERKNNNEGYTPENCKWATAAEQSINKRNNINISAFGETKCLEHWGKDKRCNVTTISIKKRIRNGWDAEKAITEFPRRTYQEKHFFV